MVHTVKLDPSWSLINRLSEIDKFGGSWEAIEKREGAGLKHLKSIATVRSVGASTRIEGSRMTDDEVAVLLNDLRISTLEERDQQEVAGYFDTLDVISESFVDIEISESSIKGLHNILMRYNQKDEWHKGDYKQHSNMVEAIKRDGSKQIIFRPTEPGFETEDAMRRLITWYNSDRQPHSIAKSAIFVYDFLSIHPFQDGNGRLSRLLGILLLLKNGYKWIQYVSFEHEIENRKDEYYKVLMECQRNRPGEDVSAWVDFFLSCLISIQQQLLIKLQTAGMSMQMTPREKKIFQFIENHPGSKSGAISEKLDIPLPTIKRILAEMTNQNLLQKHGIGAGTNYIVQSIEPIKKDLLFIFTDQQLQKRFRLSNRSSFVELKKIILAPKFSWISPNEWSSRLVTSDLYVEVKCLNSRGATVTEMFSIMAYNHPTYYQPVFSLSSRPIIISSDLWDTVPIGNDYPIEATITLIGSLTDFDIKIVYDQLK
jgi:Fic family protein